MTTDELKALLYAAAPGPWAYRPTPRYDDWGVVKNADGFTICQARDPSKMDNSTLSDHRRSRRDPWQQTARLIAMAPDLLAEVLALRAEIAALSHPTKPDETSAYDAAAWDRIEALKGGE